jgi:pyruvate formate lyase activating enzyme
MLEKVKSARIFNIQKYSLYDGSGIRTLIFFKGCPLRCKWCSNPEGLNYNFDIMKKESLCINCGKCVDVCPVKIHKMKNNKHFIDRKITCLGTRLCENICPKNALTVMGKDITIDEICADIERDEIFYEVSGGGITLGGGEVTFQKGDFAVKLLKRIKEIGINTAIETCGFTTWENLKKFILVTDLFLYDIKHIDSKKHKELTGVENKKILNNLQKLLLNNASVTIRLPIMNTLNNDNQTIDKTIKFIKNLKNKENIKGVDILPYHKLGVGKYKQLGIKYALENENIDNSHKNLKEIKEKLTKSLKPYNIPVSLLEH